MASFEDSCNSKKANLMNARQYDRNIPSSVLQPYLSVRPVATKYTVLPVVDPRTPANVHLKVQPVYNVNQTFNPGNTRSPWSGFATNVNLESELRGQIYALQSCSQSVYVPSSKSDLYSNKFNPNPTSSVSQPFPGLFEKQHFQQFNPNTENVGKNFFQNCTQQQLKDANPPFCYT
jgi:hypothetical protein